MKLTWARKNTSWSGRRPRGRHRDIADKLGRAKINVTAMDAASAGGGRFGAILWVKPRDVVRAAKVLGAK